jgi:hypothetical protein
MDALVIDNILFLIESARTAELTTIRIVLRLAQKAFKNSMNPQPDSYHHPEVMDSMKEFDDAIASLQDYRENKKSSTDDFGTIAYENTLISHVLQAHRKLVHWCGYHGITLPDNFDLPKIITIKKNTGATDGTGILNSY